MFFREAYNHAVTDIKWLAGNPDTAEARHDLAALKALIVLLEGKLPPEAPDYGTEQPHTGECIHCNPAFKPTGPDNWCYCKCHAGEGGF